MAVETNNGVAKAGSNRRMKMWLAFIVLFMSWAAYTLFGQMKQQEETLQRYTLAEQQKTEAAQQRQKLKQEIDRLNDPEYIEQLATKEQGMVKDGEKVIQVIE